MTAILEAPRNAHQAPKVRSARGPVFAASVSTVDYNVSLPNGTVPDWVAERYTVRRKNPVSAGVFEGDVTRLVEEEGAAINKKSGGNGLGIAQRILALRKPEDGNVHFLTWTAQDA